jgi:hypothetical protein
MSYAEGLSAPEETEPCERCSGHRQSSLLLRAKPSKNSKPSFESDLNTTMTEPWLTKREVAQELQVSPRTVTRLKLPHTRVGGQNRYRMSDVEAALEEHRGAAVVPVTPETRSIHADASRKGKAVEHLIAALCVLGSDGELNAWTSLVDDEGVDLVLQQRNQPQTLSLQVKSRLTTAKGIAVRQRFQSQVRSATLHPRDDLYILFVVANPSSLDLGPIWLVPSQEFAEKSPAGSNQKHRFSASAKSDTKDQWSDYLVTKTELPNHLLAVLREMGS